MTYAGRIARVAAMTAVALGLMGGVAGAAGSHTATKNRIEASGAVTEVDGNTTAGSCGTAGAAGEFTIIATNNSVTPPTTVTTSVQVTTATSFVEHKMTGVTFANLCVGDKALVIGTTTLGTFTASAVQVMVPPATKPVKLFGAVTTVNGSTTIGSCGTAGAAGSFVEVWTDNSVSPPTTSTVTVDVTPATVVTEAKVTGATIANLCVGDNAMATGAEAAGVLDATSVKVRVPPPPKAPPSPSHLSGTVVAVGGVTTAGTCGTAGSAGNYTITWIAKPKNSPPVTLSDTVYVTTTTTFAELKVTDPTFANLCIGDRTLAIGSTTSGIFTATAVALHPPAAS